MQKEAEKSAESLGEEEGGSMDELLLEMQRASLLLEILQEKFKKKLEWSKELQNSLEINDLQEVERLANVKQN